MGIATMCLFSILGGILRVRLMKKTDSIWPAVFCHSAINTFSPLVCYMVAPADQGSEHQILRPAAAGLLGMIPVGILASFEAKDLFRKKHG